VTVERRAGKFACPKCARQYNRTNNLVIHWRKCLTRPGNEGIPSRMKNTNSMRRSGAGKRISEILAI
jgi:hypothetical protein